jgi:leader peptidase (prepilin peptidase)/N-methyltransferase
MILLSILVAVFPIKGLPYWAAVPLFAFLMLILTIDMEYRAVLNETSIAGAILMLIFGIFMNGIVNTLLGGVAGYGAMLLLYYGGILFTRVLSRIRHQEIDEVALGFGDVNVTGFLGLLVGWPDILSTLVVAILLGGVISLLMIVGLLLTKRYQAFSAIPYTPFLILAAIFVLFVR